MKRTLLHILAILILSVQLQAQVVIDRDDYPRGKTFVDSVYRSTESFPQVPTEGPNQDWDYSNLVLDESFEREYFDATNDMYVSGALNWKVNDLIFQGFIIPSDSYEVIDDVGWYDMARYNYGVGYSIAAISGGANDSLWFDEGPTVFGGRINNLKFPVEYEKQWIESRVENIPFTLSIEAFGLDKTPGNRQRTITDTREVVGHGLLKLPKADGTETSPIDVLLIKSKATEIDSVFLGPAPAPPALLGAFGLTQGATRSEIAYLFYTPGFGAPVMSLDESEGNAFYRPQAAKVVTSTNDINFEAFNLYPNPATAGKQLMIVSDIALTSGFVNITDMTGKLVFQAEYISNSSQEITIDIPLKIGTGMYFYQIVDLEEGSYGIGKIFVK